MFCCIIIVLFEAVHNTFEAILYTSATDINLTVLQCLEENRSQNVNV